ncbi:putative RNA polymerase sigma factor SigI [Peptoniphilus sp. ING2-D1G]|nr:putative RNA polymerase sigma factor SigI [Peptoniphilus sp. ING2-D1G]
MEKEILRRIKEAHQSEKAHNELISDYMPFIKAETARFMGKSPMEGIDDELSIAMFAFHEAIKTYQEKKGAFITFAKMHIRHRLIDFSRREKRHKNIISLDQPFNDENGETLKDTIVEEKNEVEESMSSDAIKKELTHFSEIMANYSLSLRDIAENSPKQERTLMACQEALAYAKKNPHLIEKAEKTGKVPLTELAEGSGVSKKTLERHRKYMLAIIIVYTNGFDFIRDHLSEISAKEGGGQ